MRYEKRGFAFEWDPKKAELNQRKHGYTFEEVADVLLDEYCTIIGIRIEDNGESRFKAIGMVDDRLMILVYTRRDGRYRVISGRKAKRNERRKYCGLQS